MVQIAGRQGNVVGWFDDVADMERTYDRYRGKSAIVLEDGKFRLE